MSEPARTDPIHATSAAVSLTAQVESHALSTLSDEDAEHLADVMARVWLRSNRLGLLGSVGPIVGCTGLAMAEPTWISAAFSFGFFGFLIGTFTQAIATRIFLRGLDLEVETLGYDTRTQKAARRAYSAALRTWLPRFGLRRKRAACRKALERARRGL